jgi:hypothetical protein
MHVDPLKFATRNGTFEVSSEDRSEWEIPCACPAAQTKGHRYDCPHFRIVLKTLLERGSENEKQSLLEGLRMMLQVLSQDEDKEQLSQLRNTLDELKIGDLWERGRGTTSARPSLEVGFTTCRVQKGSRR